MDTFTETSTAQDQGLVAVNSGDHGQGPRSVSEVDFHSDLTTIQQHIVGDGVSSGRENGKTSLFMSKHNFTFSPCADIHSLMALLTFKKCSQCTCILLFRVRPG